MTSKPPCKCDAPSAYDCWFAKIDRAENICKCLCHHTPATESAADGGWETAEKATYEKWKREHPDVILHEPEGDPMWETPHEWWVRNYVESRLYPFISDLLRKETQNAFEKGWEEGAKAEREKWLAGIDDTAEYSGAKLRALFIQSPPTSQEKIYDALH